LLLRADLPEDRSLAALAVRELRHRGIRVKIAARPLGRVAARRALAGIEPGGASTRRLARLGRTLRGAAADRRGQALPGVLGVGAAVILGAAALAAVGGAVTGKGRAQRVADLAAVSAARSMRDDLPRLLSEPRLPRGSRNPFHLSEREYLARARVAALEAARRNGVAARRVRVGFPGVSSLGAMKASVRVRGSIGLGHGARHRQLPVIARAVAEASVPGSWSGTETAVSGSGGGYRGSLAYRQGRPMRPDVAAAFDRMAASARRSGIGLVVNSAFRSDAEQARLFAAHPDPRWVAPPGRSLHRCGTELDLGPPGAYGWLARNARRFGFVQRYSWEAWHYGFTQGPRPCSRAASAIGAASRAGLAGRADGRAAGRGGLPGFVPSRFRAPLLRSAARWNVSAGLLAAQIMAESGFNPFAVSPAGARGIAQFMPGTGASYGLRNPFDAKAAIDAQAHLMNDLLRRFRSVPLALAAYNAGAGAVSGCHCIPFAETRAYVTRILGLLRGTGELEAPLEVRLVF
jgi:hypothetical protein